MREWIITAMLLVVAIIHLIPISGFVGVAQLESLYGLAIASNDLEILLRHRAMLFGIMGLFFACAAFRPGLQPMAFAAAALSIGSFFYLAATAGDYSSAISKIVMADGVAAVCLVVAVIVFCTKKQSPDRNDQ